VIAPRLILPLLITFCVSCGGKDTPSHAKPAVSLAEKLVEVRESLPMCGGIVVFTDAYEGCHQPNGGLYHGILCFSGEQWACDVVPLHITRNSLVKDIINAGADHGGSGSRDELVGHLFYLLETADRQHANDLISIIRRNGNKLCTDATDNRCEITPAMWGLMRVVWNKLGWELTTNMVVGNMGDDSALVMSAYTAPIGYQTHLIALSLLLRAKTDTWSAQCQKALETLLDRHPTILVKWLSGKDVSEELLKALEQNEYIKNRGGKVSSWPWANDKGLRPKSDHPAALLWLGNLIVHK